MNNIDEVIIRLGEIIDEAEQTNDPAGYFAALYQKVTIKVKDGIEQNFFDNGKRMEQFDILFALRYIEAWDAWKQNHLVTLSWQIAFECTNQNHLIVLQHMLLGMNAHINLDLGIAAAEASGENLEDIQEDFDKINEILSDLVHEVQDSLSSIWPFLKVLLRWSGKVDDYLVDFSMKKARDGAWKFAESYFNTPDKEKRQCIETRDKKVRDVVNVILKPGLLASLVLWIIRVSERGTVREKIQKLKIQN